MTGDQLTDTRPHGSVPLSAPFYGASIAVAWTRFWKKYAIFSGRASRSEFWWWYLIQYVINGILGTVAYALAGMSTQPDGGMGAVVVYAIWGAWGLATIIPTIAVHFRRLHDANRSAGWIFIALVPLVGWIILIILLILPSDPAGARFDRRGQSIQV